MLGVTVGAFAGEALPFPSEGIDFAMTSLFLVILTEQCRTRVNRIPALIGGVSAVIVFVLLALLIGGVRARADMLIPSMVLAIIILLSVRSRLEPLTTDH